MKKLSVVCFLFSIPVNCVAAWLILEDNRTGATVWMVGLALWGAGMLLSRVERE